MRGANSHGGAGEKGGTYSTSAEPRLTEFEHWKLAVSRLAHHASYTEWLEARSARLRKIEDQSCAEWLKAEAERLAQKARPQALEGR